MAIITLPAAIKSAAGRIAMRLVRQQEALRTFGGTTQVTSYPEVLWACQIDIVPQFGANLRLWSLAMTQLSDLSNKFAIGPPHYDGPSTGYSGASPTVDGTAQTGTTLNVTGLTPSTAILLAGDYISFDVTSTGSNTNRQLIQVTKDVTSDSSGDAEISLAVPIRQSPAGSAAVNITTPTAFFSFEAPEAGVDINPSIYSTFTLNAIERIDP